MRDIQATIDVLVVVEGYSKAEGEESAKSAVRLWLAGRPGEQPVASALDRYFGMYSDPVLYKHLVHWSDYTPVTPLVVPSDLRTKVIGPARLRFAAPIIDDLVPFLTRVASGGGTGRASKGRIVHVGPGGGKTKLAIVALCEALSEAPNDVYWVAHSRILLGQAREAWEEVLAQCGAELVRRPWLWRARLLDSIRDPSTGRFVDKSHWRYKRVRGHWQFIRQSGKRVCRVHFLTPTQARKRLRPDNWEPRLVVVDEVHWGAVSSRPRRTSRSWSTSLRAIVRDPSNRTVGLSATPTDEQREPSGDWDIAASRHVSLQELTSLVEPQICAIPEFKLIGKRYRISSASDGATLARFARWLAHRRGRHKKTLVIVQSIKQADRLKTLVNEFIRSAGGVEVCGAVHSGSTSDPLDDFREGNIDILFSVNMLSVGMDVRDVMTVVLARAVVPTGYFQQCIGRGARVFGRGEGERFTVVCMRDAQRKSFEVLYGVSATTRGHRDGDNARQDSHRLQLGFREARSGSDHQSLEADERFEDLRDVLADRWTLRCTERRSPDDRLAGASVRLTSDLILREELASALDTLDAVLSGSEEGRSLELTDVPGLNFTIHPFPGNEPSYEERGRLARYLLLLTSYLEPTIVTLGVPQQYGEPVYRGGDLVDVRIGELRRVLPCTQAFQDKKGQPLSLDPRSAGARVGDVFAVLRKRAGDARDCVGIDVERLLDNHPSVWVRFTVGAPMRSTAGLTDWIDLWRGIVDEAHRYARGEKDWLLPAVPRRDQLLPTAAVDAWLAKLLPDLDSGLAARLVGYARENREHWRAAGPTPAFWADMWPVV